MKLIVNNKHIIRQVNNWIIVHAGTFQQPSSNYIESAQMAKNFWQLSGMYNPSTTLFFYLSCVITQTKYCFWIFRLYWIHLKRNLLLRMKGRPIILNKRKKLLLALSTLLAVTLWGLRFIFEKCLILFK